MKKTISLLLCVIMVMAIATCAFAKLPGGVIKPGTGSGTAIGGGEAAEITDFKAKVEAIGEVTLEDKEAIEAAEAALANIKTLAGKSWALQYESALAQWTTALEDARTAYDALVASSTPGTGDGTMLFVALAMLSMTGLVIMVSKKKAY